MKFPNYPEFRYVIAYLSPGLILKHKAVFGDCQGEQQIFSCFNFIYSNFYRPQILKERKMECIGKDHSKND